jgi:DNA-binding transcriptional LysR family regulator
MQMSTRQLRAFLNVVKYGNFTKAADAMHITQAGLSSMIHQLETQLRSRLFNRTTRSVELTVAGGHLLPHIRRALEDLDAGIESLSYMQEQRRGRLRVGITPFLASHLMPKPIGLFEALTGLQVELVDAEQHIIQSMVDGDELDAAYGYFFAQTSGVRKHPVYTDRLALIAPLGSFSRCLRIESREDWDLLHDASLIGLPRSNSLRNFIQELLVQIDAPTFQRREVRHLATILGLVAEGHGIALVPETSLIGSEASRVRRIPILVSLPPIEHCCLTKSGSPSVDGLEVFSGLVAAAYRETVEEIALRH